MSRRFYTGLKGLVLRLLKGPFKSYNKTKIRQIHQDRPFRAQTLDLSALKGKNILVLSPHIDDEVLGLGEFFLSLKGKAKIDLLYTTNNKEGQGGEIRFRELDEIAGQLDLHVIKAIDIPNAQESSHLRDQWTFFVEEIGKALLAKEYDLICSVNFLDAHIDHEATTFALAESLERLEDRLPSKPRILLYQGSNFLPYAWINRYLLIDDRDRKKLSELCRIFASQIYIEFPFYEFLAQELAKNYLHSREAGEFYRLMSYRDFLRLAQSLDFDQIVRDYPFRFYAHHSFYRMAKGERDRQEKYARKLRSLGF